MIDNYQVKQKLEGIERELKRTKEMVEEIIEREEMKDQRKLDRNQMAMCPQNPTWSEYALRKWPTKEEYTLWIKNTHFKFRTDLYAHITGEKITPLRMEELTLALYPKVEVVGGV